MPNNFKEIEKKIADLDMMKVSIEEGTVDATTDWLDEVQRTMRELISAQDAVASTALIRSVRWRRLTETKFEILAGGDERGAGHAPFVEFGTGTHNNARGLQFMFEAPDGVPLDEILTWMKQKGIGDDESTAWAIKRHIEKYGTSSSPFFRRAIRLHTEQFYDKQENMLESAVERHN